MIQKNYAILTDESSLRLMCIRPCQECSLIQTFKDIENVSSSATHTPENTLVLGLTAKGTDKEKQSLLPTIQELTQQICNMCQRNR